MASAADNMAANLSLANFAKAADLKKRLWFTLGALILFRLLSFIPLPGIDPRALSSLFETTRGGVLDFFNMFSGGSLERMSLIALGVALLREISGEAKVDRAQTCQCEHESREQAYLHAAEERFNGINRCC